MFETVKRLALGLVLIALAAAVLLYTDRGSRKSARKQSAASRMLQVAIVQHASIAALEEGYEGVIQALEQRGYADGERVSFRRYNAEADLGTANTIAREVTSGSYDLIISLSTPSLQTIANANKVGNRTRHVFGLVSDPAGAGVGIEATNGAIHPPYMTGYGCMQPVESTLRMARAMRPELKTVGLVWNAAEANSLAQTRIARRVCQELGVTLVEANADSSTAAIEAVHSVISRGVEALWISGDITVWLAADALIAAARRAQIPVFTCFPPSVLKGSLFDLGANYVQVGRSLGDLAADVLDGKNPADIPVKNYVPELFLINETVPATLKDRWVITAETRQRASGTITATSTNLPAQTSVTRVRKPQPGKTYKIGLAYFAPEAGADSCMRGIFDGLRELGFEEGRNLQVRRVHAQAEIANIPAMLQTLDSSDVDLILPMSTPVISGACGTVRHKPVVFTYCSDPIAAGVGKSFTNHLPFITGIGSFPPVQDMVDVIRKTMPGAKSVGTIYNAAEANSVKVVTVARDIFARAGLKLEEVTVATSAEVLQAGQALAARGVDAIYIQGDNTVIQGFDAVVKATQDAKLPLFVDDPESAQRGAVACVGLGYYAPGYAAARMVARVLLGENPGNIPIENVSEKTVWLDLQKAAKLGLQFPKETIDEAARAEAHKPVKPARSKGPLSRKAKVDIIEYVESPNTEANREGILHGLEQEGLKIGRDIELRVRNAQGDMATLSTIIDAAISDQTDLLIVCTTPALQAALRRTTTKHTVFSLVANPMIAGAGKSETDHLPHVTGAYLPAPHREGLAALRQCIPNVRRVGTLFTPAEINSVFYKDELLKAAAAAGIEVELIGVTNTGEIADAAMALCSRNIDAICQISDNLTGSSFASIAQAARRSRLPLMSFASGQVKNGSFMTVSRDFYDGGVASAEMAARVLRGESPADIPFYLVEKITYLFNVSAAQSIGLQIPEDLLKRGKVVN